jgi:hypothetical protein
MRNALAILAAIASLPAGAHAVTCGAGTHLDVASDTCIITTAANMRVSRQNNNQPSIETEDGNIVIAVDSAGKQVGYRIGQKTIYFDEMASELRGYTAGSIGAIALGYKVGVAESGSNAILDYLKDDLSKRVEGLTSSVSDVEKIAVGLTSDVNSKLSAQNEKAAADLKSTRDTLTAAVNAALKKQDDAAAAAAAEQKKDISNLQKDLEKVKTAFDAEKKCAENAFEYNPITKECCKKNEIYSVGGKKCMLDLWGTDAKPARNCHQIYKEHNYDKSKNGFYSILVLGNTLKIYCKFDGDYPGATLVARKPGRVGGEQQRTGRVRYPCGYSTSTGSYCKLTDKEITALAGTSTSEDGYVSLSYKNSGTRPRCRSFAKKDCVWNMVSASNGCSHGHVRNSGQYCRRDQKHNSYRGLDGHRCSNLDYYSNNKYASGDGGVQARRNAFNIWEHSGGTHYCGGWDTSWHRIELWIH